MNPAAIDLGKSLNSIRIVTLTRGNIRNHHIYLPLDFFPPDAIGGRNKAEMARQAITVRFSPGPTVDTDIDGTKRILRARSEVRSFFETIGAAEEDRIQIAKLQPYVFEISRYGTAPS